MCACTDRLSGLIGGGARKPAPCAGSVGIAAVPVQAKDGAAKGVVSGAGGVVGGPGGWGALWLQVEWWWVVREITQPATH